MRALRAIEAGEFQKLPGGVYSTSYIRQYARAIEFDSIDQRIVRSQHRVCADPRAHYFRNFSDRVLFPRRRIPGASLAPVDGFQQKNFQAYDAAADDDDGVVPGPDAEPAGENSAAAAVAHQVRVGDAVVQHLMGIDPIVRLRFLPACSEIPGAARLNKFKEARGA